MGLIIVALAINFLSAEIAGKINTFMSSLILVFLVGLAGVSWFIVSRDAPAASTVMIAPPDLHRFGLTFMMVFFAFTGWEVSANLGAEFRNPHRDLPRAMALSFAIAVVLYLALAAVVARSGEMGAGPAPFARIFGICFRVGGNAHNFRNSCAVDTGQSVSGDLGGFTHGLFCRTGRVAARCIHTHQT